MQLPSSGNAQLLQSRPARDNEHQAFVSAQPLPFRNDDIAQPVSVVSVAHQAWHDNLVTVAHSELHAYEAAACANSVQQY